MARKAKLTPEQADLLRKEFRARDPVRAFCDTFATVTQKEVLASTATYTLVTTANQGGKTTVAIVDCAAALRGVHPHKPWFGPIHVLIIVPSRAQASGIWGKRLLDRSDIRQKIKTPLGQDVDLSQVPLIPESEIEQIVWAYSPQGKYPGYCKLKNGSEFRIALSGDSGSWERVQGFTYDAVYRDEAVGNENLGDELLLRLAAAQTAVKNGSRPWGGTIMWVATATLVNDEFEMYRERCVAGEPGHQIFWIDPKENPAVSMEVRDDMRGSMSEHAAAVRLDGTAGAVDDILLLRKHLDGTKHRMAYEYQPGPLDNLWVAWDPGWDHPYGLLFLAVSPDAPSQLKVWKAINGRHKTLDHIANEVAMTLDGRIAEALVFDPAAKKTEHSRGQSVAFQMEQLLAQMKVRTHRGVLYGRNRYEDTIPGLIQYLSDGNVVISAGGGCEMVWNQMMKYRRRPTVTGSAMRGHNIHKHEDEFIDLLRYVTSRKPYYCERAPQIGNSAPLSVVAAAAGVNAPPKDPYEHHLMLSRQRRPPRGSRWTVSEF